MLRELILAVPCTFPEINKFLCTQIKWWCCQWFSGILNYLFYGIRCGLDCVVDVCRKYFIQKTNSMAKNINSTKTTPYSTFLFYNVCVPCIIIYICMCKQQCAMEYFNCEVVSWLYYYNLPLGGSIVSSKHISRRDMKTFEKCPQVFHEMWQNYWRKKKNQYDLWTFWMMCSLAGLNHLLGVLMCCLY
jgi:hypothetical protein